MANEYVTNTGDPEMSSGGASSVMRAMFTAIINAFDKLPVLATNGLKTIRVNAGGTGLQAVWPTQRKVLQADFGVNSVGAWVELTGGITLNANFFAAEDWFDLYNTTGANVTITAGAGLTLRLHGTATTGNRTLAQKGVTRVYFRTATEAIVLGPDVT